MSTQTQRTPIIGIHSPCFIRLTMTVVKLIVTPGNRTQGKIKISIKIRKARPVPIQLATKLVANF